MMKWSSKGKNKHWSDAGLRGLRGFKVFFQNRVYTVLERKNGLETKPRFFLFDLESKRFLSSLYPTGEQGAFIFDVKETGESYLIRFSFSGANTETESIEKVIGYEIEPID